MTAHERPATGRVPPHDEDAERAVLGAALLAHDAIDAAINTGLRADELYVPRHRDVWSAMLELHARGEPCDPLLIAGVLDRDGRLRAVGGRPWLYELQNTTPASYRADTYARVVRDHAAARRAIAAAAELLDDAYALRPWQPAAQHVAELVADHDQADEDASWQPVDVEAVLVHGITSPPPVILERTDGQCLMYAGRVHVIAGPPESGKTWLALVACAQLLADSATVLYIDFEDSADGVIGRLVDLGVAPDLILDGLVYIAPHAPPTPAVLAQLDAIIAGRRPALAIIDGVTEAMALWGLDPSDNADVATFTAALPRRITRAGPAVAMIDHVTKDRETRGAYAIGAQHKLAAVDGTQLTVTVVRSFGRGRSGLAHIDCRKDRQGHVRGAQGIGDRVAELHVTATEGGALNIALRPPTEPGTWRPSTLMERVSRALEQHGDLTATELHELVKGKAEAIRKACGYLVDDGNATATKGPRGKITFHIVTPYERPADPPPDTTQEQPDDDTDTDPPPDNVTPLFEDR